VAAELIVGKVYRKKISLIGMSLSSAMCLITAVLTAFQTDDNQKWMVILETAVLLLNRFILCCSWAIFYVYIGELFPTTVKSLGFGWASAMGTIGSAASPYFRLAADSFDFSPWIIPGLVGIVAAGSIFCLP
jgi:MFS transporter, OCT family, solute carrier family 22 (organic cation transporter), member 4/5